MRIFIKDYNLSNLNNIIKLLEKYLVKTTIQYDAFSNEGIYQIDNSNIYKLEKTDKKIKIHKNYFNNFTILVDSSDIIKVKENQIPPDSIVISIKNMFYQLNSNSKIKLLIQVNNETHDLILIDFYFIIDEETDIDNIFIKNELNVFLSLLN